MKRMNTSESFLLPKKEARAPTKSVDDSLLDGESDGGEQSDLAVMDTSFQLGNEMEISAIAPVKQPPHETPNPAELNKHEEDETSGDQGIKDKEDPSGSQESMTATKTYADSVAPKKTKPLGTHDNSDQVKNRKSKYRFTAEELMEMEAEVEKLKCLKNPEKWLQATKMSMKFIECERTTTIIYVAEREALPQGMKTPEVIKQFGETTQTNTVQDVLLRENIVL